MDFRRGVSPALSPGTLSLSFDDYRTDRASEVDDKDKSTDEQSISSAPSLAATLPTEVILQ
jgi:hypothetical protein